MTVDTGFDAVLAGEVYVHPDPSSTAVPHEALSNQDVIAPQHPPVSPSDDTVTTTVTAAPADGLTPAGVQAAKALVHLPTTLDAPTLAKLAREIAMDVKERHVILKEFNLTQVQYDYLEANNDFYRSALQAASIEWHAPLSTAERIKVEAAAILEDSLPGLGARMQNKGEGLPGVIEAAKLFAKVAGVGEREHGAAAGGERFVINIDLGGDQKITLSTQEATQAAPQPDPHRSLPLYGQTDLGRLPVQSLPEGGTDQRAVQSLPEGARHQMAARSDGET